MKLDEISKPSNLTQRLLQKLYDDDSIRIHVVDEDEIGIGWAIVDGYKLTFPWSPSYGIYDDQVEIEPVSEGKKKRKKKRYGPEDLEDIKVRKATSNLVRTTKVHDKDPRKKSRAQQKQEFKRQLKDYS